MKKVKLILGVVAVLSMCWSAHSEDRPVLADNLLADWNTEDSAFGRWAFQNLRIVSIECGYQVDMNTNAAPVGVAVDTNAPAWMGMLNRPQRTPKAAMDAVKMQLLPTKMLCDAMDRMANAICGKETNAPPKVPNANNAVTGSEDRP